MRALLVFALTACLAASAAGCNGGSHPSSQPTVATTGGGTQSTGPQTLTAKDFTNKVAAAIVTGSNLQADPTVDLVVDVSQPDGLDTLRLTLAPAYRRYQASPAGVDALVQGLVKNAVTQMRNGNSGRSFAGARDRIMPLLKRKSVVDKAGAGPVSSAFHDLDVVYGVQTARSFSVVTKHDLARWGHPLAEIERLALSNLERETNAKQKLLCEPSGNQKLCGWASGDGYDATRMLVPGLRRQIVEQLGGPAVYAVPLESVFVALTRNYASVIKEKVLQEFTTGANPLSPDLFVERNGKLVVLSS